MHYPGHFLGAQHASKIDTSSKFKRFLKDRSSDIKNDKISMIFRDRNLAIFTAPILTLPKPSPLKGVCLFLYVWFSSLFFSHFTMLSGCCKKTNAHLFSDAPLKSNAQFMKHNTPLNHIILIPE